VESLMRLAKQSPTQLVLQAERARRRYGTLLK
jgi:hypothetical protein